MLYGGEAQASVVVYIPHGCRHVKVTAGAELAQQGMPGEASLEPGALGARLQNAEAVRFGRVRHGAPDTEVDRGRPEVMVETGSGRTPTGSSNSGS